MFLISDFKDTGYEKQLRLSSKRHSLIAITLQDRREVELPNVGLIELADAESGETIVIDTRSEAARQSYREILISVLMLNVGRFSEQARLILFTSEQMNPM